VVRVIGPSIVVREMPDEAGISRVALWLGEGYASPGPLQATACSGVYVV
jgi:hypothetical protein